MNWGIGLVIPDCTRPRNICPTAAPGLYRADGDGTEFITFTFWDSLDAIHGFAGEPVERAVFYPEDDRFLVDRERQVHHFELVEQSPW